MSATRPTTRSPAAINIIILSDRAVGPDRAPIPSLLAVAAVHHHLVREGTRLQAGLVIETGEARQVHHIATLIGYGASVVNPWLMFETVGEEVDDGLLVDAERARARPRRGRDRRAQGDRQGPAEDDLEDGDLDDPVLLRRADLRGGRPLALAGRPPLHRAPRRGSAAIGLDVLAQETLTRHARALPRSPRATCCRSAASTPGGATASTTCGTRTRSRCCSTPCAAAARRPTTSSRASPTRTRRGARRCAACSRSAATRRRSRSRRSSRGPRSSSAS